MVQLGEHEGYLQARGWARNLEASLALLAGEYAAAQGLADEARTILDRRLDPDRLSSRALHALLAAAHNAEARSRADAALATLRTFAAQAPMAKPRLATLRAFRDHALGRDARPAARAALRLAEQWQMPIERLRALELLARLGEPREAEEAGLRAALARGWREG